MVSIKRQTVFEDLTPREIDILWLLIEGLSDREIAERLVITIGTVKWYNRQIYGKLAVSNRAQAINRVHEFGLLQPNFTKASAKTSFPRHNLPAETTQFIGRESEIGAVKELMQVARLLTLTGSPGTGKTRLSLRVGVDVLPVFSDGVFFVNLAPLDDGSLLPLAIADALGLKEKTTETIVDTLRHTLLNQQLLLILDNYEHLLPTVTLVSDLLQVAPGLKILVTSREPLHLYGEQEYNVPPLKLPDTHDTGFDKLAQCEAVALFLQQARSVQPDFALTDENILDVAKICVRLDGLPLAIELAAARSKLLSPSALLKRLTNPFHVLVGGSRNLAARQRTMRETIDWSYNLLGEDEKKLFTHLSIFAGGLTLEAVQAVCSEDMLLGLFEGLESLVDKSLVRQSELDGEPRFTMLETIRKYALERLQASGGIETLRRRHAQYYIELAEQVEEAIDSVDQRYALDHLELEHDNFRAVLSWSKSADPDLGLGLIAALGRCWQMGGHQLEGFRWSQSLLEASEQVSSQVRAKALRSASRLAYDLGYFEKSEQMSREALALARQTGDEITVAEALHAFGISLVRSHMTTDDCHAANAVFDEALVIFQAQSDALGIASIMTCKGEIARLQENFELAAGFNEQAVSLFSQLGNSSGVAISETNLGWITYRQGNYRRAKEYFREGLTLAQRIHDKSGTLGAVAGLAGLAATSRQSEQAIRLYGAIETQQKMYGNGVCAADLVDYDICVRAARAQMDETLFIQLLEEGRSLTLETAIEYMIGESDD